jgi:NAD(P)-dependent dehydrogenase (short-subunit alcohol dehydrogenase family)
MMLDFTGRVALVTGAGGNLGQATAGAFRAAGAKTVLVDRDREGLRQAFPDLAGSSDHLLAGGLDLMAPRGLDGVVAEALTRFGRIDILVNTVGGFRAGETLAETPMETWDLMLDLNVRTTLVAVRAVIPTMLAQCYGRIITIAARAAVVGPANMAAYAASKAAVLRLTESLAAEVKNAGINVNCVLPGTLDTPQNRRERPDADFSRWVPVEDVAGVILFLASDAARAIHGAAVPAYGLS